MPAHCGTSYLCGSHRRPPPRRFGSRVQIALCYVLLGGVGTGCATPVPAITIHLRPASSEPTLTASIAKAFDEGYVRTFQLLDDQIALAFVETWPPKWSGLFLVNLKTHKASEPIAPLGEMAESGRDLSGNVWTIVKGENDAPGYIAHGYSAFTVRRIAAHQYKIDRMWLPDFAGEYESEENLCLYFKPHELVNLDVALTLQSQTRGATALDFRLSTMECPGREKAVRSISFAPQTLGFATPGAADGQYQISGWAFPET